MSKFRLDTSLKIIPLVSVLIPAHVSISLFHLVTSCSLPPVIKCRHEHLAPSIHPAYALPLRSSYPLTMMVTATDFEHDRRRPIIVGIISPPSVTGEWNARREQCRCTLQTVTAGGSSSFSPSFIGRSRPLSKDI